MYPRIGAHKSVDDFRKHLNSLGLSLPVDDRALSAAEGSPLSTPLQLGDRTIGNRWCVHPMEGWDGTADGGPSDLTTLRWKHFGESGCKLIWGGEAFAVRSDGRANPRQLFLNSNSRDALIGLLAALRSTHRSCFGTHAADDLLVGLQLTHSGRYCKPHRNDRFEPKIAWHHPILDRRTGIEPHDDSCLFRDEDIPQLIEDYVAAARVAEAAGFDFVDVKSCHGYLLHEFLSAFQRPGRYGGDLEGRTRLLREIVAAIQSECPNLLIGVRLSVFDQPPFRSESEAASPLKKGIGVPETARPGFGAAADDPFRFDPSEPVALLRRLRDDYGVRLFNLSAGSPYYNPHILRPAYYPPSDGYGPPEDPLAGCVRQLQAVRIVKEAVPDVLIVGSAYSYFQEFLPHVAQAVVREGWVDMVGLGRLMLSDWTLPAKVLAGEDYAAAKKICRTFSDCTTAPRHGMVSGCYPLDEHYKTTPEAAAVKRIKAGRDT